MHKALRSPSSASLCSAPSPFRGKAFIVLHFIMLDQSYQRSHSAKADSRIQPRPVAADSAAGRRAGKARPRGKAGSERRKACFHPGGSGFHLPRRHTTLPSFSLKPVAFMSHTGSLLLSSPKKVTFPSSPLVFLVPSHGRAMPSAQAAST